MNTSLLLIAHRYTTAQATAFYFIAVALVSGAIYLAMRYVACSDTMLKLIRTHINRLRRMFTGNDNNNERKAKLRGAVSDKRKP